MNVAIIPARGGSKRIPRKNIRPFCGRPMIAWPIAAALASACFEHVIVSTDDDEIAECAQKEGAAVPFRRPPQLADDYAPTRPVVNHAISALAEQIGMPDHVCCIYPTAPFLTDKTLRDSYRHLLSTGADFVFSCTSFAYPIRRSLRINGTGEAERIWPEHRFTRSQDLEEAYHDAGQFYWGRTEAFLQDQDTFGPGNRPWILPRHLVHDIDTPEDWARAELAFRILQSSERAGSSV